MLTTVNQFKTIIKSLETRHCSRCPRPNDLSLVQVQEPIPFKIDETTSIPCTIVKRYHLGCLYQTPHVTMWPSTYGTSLLLFVLQLINIQTSILLKMNTSLVALFIYATQNPHLMNASIGLLMVFCAACILYWKRPQQQRGLKYITECSVILLYFIYTSTIFSSANAYDMTYEYIKAYYTIFFFYRGASIFRMLFTEKDALCALLLTRMHLAFSRVTPDILLSISAAGGLIIYITHALFYGWYRLDMAIVGAGVVSTLLTLYPTQVFPECEFVYF